MNKNQVFVLSLVVLLCGVGLVAFTEQSEVGVTLIGSVLAVLAGAKVWEARAAAKKAAPLLLVGSLALLCIGCAGPSSLYVQADRATYEAVAPAHAAYVEADPNLSAEQKARRLRTLTSWDDRVKAAEGGR